MRCTAATVVGIHVKAGVFGHSAPPVLELDILVHCERLLLVLADGELRESMEKT